MNTVQKYSKKRETILDVIRSTKTHPCAEWIYNQVKSVYPDLSLGTVYRNLLLFEKNGDVTVVGNVNGQKRYDYITNPHTHFICECCGSVIDIDDFNQAMPMYKEINSQYGVSPTRHNLTFFGKCAKCKN